jgi:hypothetical protein
MQLTGASVQRNVSSCASGQVPAADARPLDINSNRLESLELNLRRTHWWLAALCSVLLACGEPKVPSLEAGAAPLDQHPAIGCWLLSEPKGSGFVHLPKEIRLDPVLQRWGDSTFVAGAEIDSAYRGYGARRGHWAPYPDGKHVYVAWTDGFTGMFARVRLDGDRLEGASYETSDAGPSSWRRGVVNGHRTTCTTPRLRGVGLMSNKRMKLAGASVQRNVR